MGFRTKREIAENVGIIHETEMISWPIAQKRRKNKYV